MRSVVRALAGVMRLTCACAAAVVAPIGTVLADLDLSLIDGYGL